MIRQLDHINVRTANLETMINWYEKVLGLASGPRPEFPFGGAWLYAGEKPIVHLVDAADAKQPDGSMQLEHMAFQGEDYEQFIRHLREIDTDYQERSIDDPVISMVQIHLHDPDGNHIHVDFNAAM